MTTMWSDTEPTMAPEVAELQAVVSERAQIEARLLEAVGAVATATGRELLSLRGVVDPEELSPTARARWRAEVKRMASLEVMSLLGIGRYEARQYVGLALSPGRVRVTVASAIVEGRASLQQARTFWSRAGHLELDDGVLVAEALFGDDPATAAPERLKPDGTLPEGITGRREFETALNREITAMQGEDVQAERQRRRLAYGARRVNLEAHDDGTGTLTVTGDLISLTGVHARVERAARLLRKHGDERSLSQLRTDVMLALLLHGELPQGEWTEQDLDRLRQIVNGTPGIEVQVVVPWDVMTGRVAGNAPQTPDGDDTRSPAGVPRETRTARILGPEPAFITEGHARELLLEPGVTLTRLLTDPADGRLIERSTGRYRPDADMRRQVIAADVQSRAPWSSVLARDAELDHVQPYADSLTTSERNLVAVNKGSHDDKTAGRLVSVINDRRDLTWFTLLGQALETRVHDYRAYAPGRPYRYLGQEQLASDLDPTIVEAWQRARSPVDGSGELDDLHDLLNLVTYAALTHRGTDAFLVDEDDDPDHDPDDPATYRTRRAEARVPWFGRSHRCATTGRRRPGPPPDQVTPEQLLGLADEVPQPARPDAASDMNDHDLPPF